MVFVAHVGEFAMRVNLRNKAVSGEDAAAIIAGAEFFRKSFVLDEFLADFSAQRKFWRYFVGDVRL